MSLGCCIKFSRNTGCENVQVSLHSRRGSCTYTDDTDLANLCAGDLEDAESDDGDVEEADYISATGRAELVPLSARGSGMNTGTFEEDKPALRE